MSELERARSALNYLDASCSREEWVCIGMAAKSAGLTFDDFHEWSKKGDNYKNEKDCIAAWKSFKETGGITAATLFKKALENGWHDIKKNYPPIQAAKISNANVIEIWERCLPAEISHGYIIRKRGLADGLRYYPDTELLLLINETNVAGYLVVLCWSNDDLQTIQFIPAGVGKKLNLPKASFNDGYFVVGTIGQEIYICEGLGQAWAIHQATKRTAIVCFGAGRMQTVAKAIRKKYPLSHLIIVPDRGKEKEANKIANHVIGQWIELPEDTPLNDDVNDFAIKFGYDQLAELLSKTKTPELRYKLLNGVELLRAPSMRWIVHGVLPAEGLAAIYGESGSGKSFLVLDMAFAIASGEAHWFDLRIMEAPVTYICLEGESGLGKRIKAWSSHTKKTIPDKFRFITQPFNLLSNDVLEISNAITASGHINGLVIIDTLNRSSPGADENSSVDMGKIIASAKKLQNLIGGLVLLVHHSGKDKSKGLRGHSSLYAALDAAIEVIKTETRREWSVAKSKDDATGISYPFKLEIVKMGWDENEQEITSCVALFDFSKKTIPKQPSLGRNQRWALEEIEKQLINSTVFGKEGAPSTSRCINFDEAVLFVSERMPTDAKHRKSRAKEAIAALVEKRYLGMRGSWLWKI